jgi:hypothetical protein
MLLAYLLSIINGNGAYVWKPALTLVDPAIVSELTPALG